MPSVRDFLNRLRAVRHIEWIVLLAVCAAAVLLLTDAAGEPRTEQTDLEMRMESVLSCVSGAGRVRVLVNQEGENALAGPGAPAQGVVVVAEGADDLRVALELQQAVQALLGVDAARIGILSMEEELP